MMNSSGATRHESFSPDDEEAALIVAAYDALRALLKSLRDKHGTPVESCRQWVLETGMVSSGVIHFLIEGRTFNHVFFLEQFDMMIEPEGVEEAGPLKEGFLPV